MPVKHDLFHRVQGLLCGPPTSEVLHSREFYSLPVLELEILVALPYPEDPQQPGSRFSPF